MRPEIRCSPEATAPVTFSYQAGDGAGARLILSHPHSAAADSASGSERDDFPKSGAVRHMLNCREVDARASSLSSKPQSGRGSWPDKPRTYPCYIGYMVTKPLFVREPCGAFVTASGVPVTFTSLLVLLFLIVCNVVTVVTGGLSIRTVLGLRD